MTEDFREESEAHWKFISNLLETAGTELNELHHLLYVEAMVHGYKHALNSGKESKC